MRSSFFRVAIFELKKQGSSEKSEYQVKKKDKLRV